MRYQVSPPTRALPRAPMAVAGVVILLLLAALAPSTAPAMGPLLQIPTPTPLPGTSGPGPGGSSGDPHLHTPDGLDYDFQAAGEFFALTSTAGDFVVQLRQEPVRTSTVASMNTAVAMNVAGDRVGIYVERQPALDVNGQPTDLSDESLPLPHGGRVERQGAQYLIVWPDQSVVEATLRSQYLDVVVRLAPARQGQVSGLLGNADGEAANDLTTRGGTVVEVTSLAAETSRERLYGEFGDSWRISQAESLFAYEPGKDTSTYTRLEFPSALVTASDLPAMAREMAEAVCRQAGVTDEAFLADCALDIGVTGNAEFAASAAAMQATLAPAGNTLPNGTFHANEINTVYLDPFSHFTAGRFIGETPDRPTWVPVAFSVDINLDAANGAVTGGAMSFQWTSTANGSTVAKSFESSNVTGFFYALPEGIHGAADFEGTLTPEGSTYAARFAWWMDAAGQLVMCVPSVEHATTAQAYKEYCLTHPVAVLKPVAPPGIS